MITNFEKMRPCIRKYLQEGLRDKLPHFVGDVYENDKDENGNKNPLACIQKLSKIMYEKTRRKMMYAITFDMNRLGFPSDEIIKTLFAWNSRCSKPVNENNAKRNIPSIVNWILNKENLLSCTALKDFCVGENGCLFSKKVKIIELNYLPGDAIIYLEKNYPAYGLGDRLGRVLLALLAARRENGFNVLFIGMEKLSGRLSNDGFHVESKRLAALLYKLEEIGFISIEQGKKGFFGTRLSNKYTFLDWKPI